MKSKVYFLKTDTPEDIDKIKPSFDRLLKESQIFSNAVSKNDRVAVKLHFGEEGNTGYVKPEYIKIILGHLKHLKARAFLTDSNTLYKGKRTNARSHLKLAKEHGFSAKALGVPVEILDESKNKASVEIDLNAEFIKKAEIMKNIIDADAIVGVAHFKGHIMTGFGAAIKNIGMGTASRKGKMEQHSSASPFVIKAKCTGCGECIKFCPVKAIWLSDNKAQISEDTCIGCATCIAVCRNAAIEVEWEAGASLISVKMAEYAKAALINKQGKCAFINFAIKITKECDCLAKDDPRVCPDLGIFASLDPVSIDKACVDMANKISGRDILAQLHPDRDWNCHLNHAAKINLGMLDYELIKI